VRALAAISPVPVTFPVVTYAGWLHKKPRGKRPAPPPTLIAYGGLAWRVRDRETGAFWCEVWFDIAEPRLMRTLTLVRWGKRMLKVARQMGEKTVFCVREARPQSDKLLRLVGFVPAPDLRTFDAADGAERPGEIWIWQASPHSEPQ
jgi:hypothetical protein